MKNDPMRRRRLSGLLWGILCAVLLLIGALCFFSARWYIQVYGDMGFASIIYTLTAGLGGVQDGLVSAYLKEGALPAVILAASVCFFLLWQPSRRLFLALFGRLRFRVYPLNRWLGRAAAVLLSVALTLHAAFSVGLPKYIRDLRDQSVLYDTVYTDPADVDIRFPADGEKKNLIYILLESMETSFFSQAEGGGLAYNCIPELYQLAEENINFSSNASVGGFYPSTNATWTIAAMVGQTSGLPLITPPDIGGNDYGVSTEEFLPGAVTLMDILHENGYYQTLMVGSDAGFGGRRTYYTQHHADHIYDYYTALADGVIPADHFVWWGLEDYYLYEYARQELPRLAAQEQPFAFTMLTVDTHHVGGWLCPLCGTDHAEQYENVYACASRQLASFIDWLRQQDFWEDTVVVVCGDHPSMDHGYFDRAMAPGTQRLVYNCFLNSAVQPMQSKNRLASTVDLFPTTLAALGCTIEGDRLALGTNLFSAVPTLAEELGQELFNAELGKNSSFYLTHMY